MHFDPIKHGKTHLQSHANTGEKTDYNKEIAVGFMLRCTSSFRYRSENRTEGVRDIASVLYTTLQYLCVFCPHTL